MKQYTLGIDFGTLSGRALVLDTKSGRVVGSAVMEYRHGVMDRALPDGTPLPPQYALQHPADYLEVLKAVVPLALERAGILAEEIAGLGIDFTTCTMLPVLEDGTPLCFLEQYEREPHAYVKLWKHHGAQAEADRIRELAEERGETWLSEYGGRISSEWMVPKIMETLGRAPRLYCDTWRFFEAGDWLTYLLTGNDRRAAGFAGFKAFWGADRGYPSQDFLAALDPRLGDLYGTKIPKEVYTVDQSAGVLSEKGAELTGLLPGTPLALPILDAAAAMPALNVTGGEEALLIVGTSGVQQILSKEKLDVPGICGAVRDAVVKDYYTYEAGQTGVGDSFDWFVRSCVPQSYYDAAREAGVGIHKYLRGKAEKLRAGESGLLALDWINGNRSVLQDADLSCMIVGLTLQSLPEEIYRALIEATAFGVRRILDTFEQNGLTIKRVLASGGIAKKDPMLMQIYSDVLEREIRVMDSDQASAHGSAIYAAVAAGHYPTVTEAAQALSVKESVLYRPNIESSRAYRLLYAEYCRLYRYFGEGENDVMKRLRKIAEGDL